MKLLASLFVAVLLAACAGGSIQPQNAGQQVLAAKQAYEVALTVAVAYRALPACSATVKLPCHEPNIVAQLQKAQPAVRSTLDAAEAAVRDPKLGASVADTALVASQATLKAFVAITSTLRVK